MSYEDDGYGEPKPRATWRLTRPERHFARTDDPGGSPRKDVEERITDKMERLPHRFEALLTDVEAFYQGGRLRTEDWKEQWDDWNGQTVGDQALRLVRDGDNDSLVPLAPRSNMVELGKKFGLLARRLVPDGRLDKDARTQLVWGFLREFYLHGRTIIDTEERGHTEHLGDLHRRLCELEDTNWIHQLGSDHSGSRFSVRDSVAWREAKESVREVLQSRDGIIKWAAERLPDAPENPIAFRRRSFSRVATAHVIRAYVATKPGSPIAVLGDFEWDHRKPDDAFDPNFIEAVFDDRRLVARRQLQNRLVIDFDYLVQARYKGVVGVRCFKQLCRLKADDKRQDTSSRSISDELDSSKDYTASVTAINEFLAGTRELPRRGGQLEWPGTPLVKEDSNEPDEWAVTSYGRLLAEVAWSRDGTFPTLEDLDTVEGMDLTQ